MRSRFSSRNAPNCLAASVRKEARSIPACARWPRAAAVPNGYLRVGMSQDLQRRLFREQMVGAIVAKHALEFYSKLWFPYQFPQLTLQDGPSAGMEYPMVINSNQGAADHETFHQWAPMTVTNWRATGASSNNGEQRQTRKTPAVTMVAA